MSDVFGKIDGKAWVGLDGFVDKITVPVKKRTGPLTAFTPYITLTDLGQTIAAASSTNLNLELYPKLEKMGGNGPLFANTLANLGVSVKYVGTLGNPIHPVFKNFCNNVQAISLGNYGETDAIECQDGKLILGKTHALDSITFENLIAHVPLDALIQDYSEASLISWQNWTMTMHMTDILENILKNIWNKIKNRPDRICFFDLADPAKRTENDVLCLLKRLPYFKNKAKVLLGANRSEIQHIGRLLGINFNATIPMHDKNYLNLVAHACQKLNIDGLIVHCRDGAVASINNQTAFAPPMKAKRLTCLTGSGDHFNGGFLSGLLMNLSLEQSLVLAHITSVLYIETGESPTKEAIQTVFQQYYF